MTDTPLPLDADVTVIRSLPDADHPLRVPNNSLVIRGPEPILVDCGALAQADEWWRQVVEVVDPADVRWVFLTHDDIDHVGNLPAVLERCPEATVVSSWLLDERLSAGSPVARGRCRWVDDGEAFEAGGRRLVALRPPVYDAPSTRGLFDVTSGVYWGADCFGVPVPYPADEVSDLDRDVWEPGLLRFQHHISPWVAQVEPLRWRAAVARVAALDANVLVSAHGPVIRRHDIGRAFDVLAELPEVPPTPIVGSSDQWMAGTHPS